jgi:hypothetical protein
LLVEFRPWIEHYFFIQLLFVNLHVVLMLPLESHFQLVVCVCNYSAKLR